MPPSTNPKKRRAQLANLRPDAATKHGVYSEAKLAPLRERFVAELGEQFDGVATVDEIELAAERRAKLEVLNGWLGRRGLLADRRSGRPRAVVQLVDRLQSAYERQLAEFRGRAGRSGHPFDSSPPMSIELTADEQLGLMASEWKVRSDTTHRILARLRDEGPEIVQGGRVRGARLDLKALSNDELDEIERIVATAEKRNGSGE